MATVVIAAFLYFSFTPDRYNLLAPIDLTDRPTFVTEWKLQLVGAEDCYAALVRAELLVERLPDEVKGPGCGFQNVGRLDRSLAAWGDGITLTCPMLAGVALWERHSLQPIAEQLFGSRVVRVLHFGTFSCRNINNESHGKRSEHATANALDVSGFVLENGERISVLDDWNQKTAKGRFLSRVHDRACKHFNVVLGPDYNSLHRDHFHFDQGDYETCR